MREILFRGKRKDNGEWVEGFYSKARYYLNGEEMHIIFPLDCEAFPRGEFTEYEWVIPETVCQFTGLYDKNGRKIFEGDILQCNNNPQDLVKAVFGAFDVIDMETETAVDNVIGWHYEVIPTKDPLSRVLPFCLPMPFTEFYIERCSMVVIGNIYDNPELLEVKQNG